MSVLVLGYVRPELDYVSKGKLSHALTCVRTEADHVAEALICDINTDVKVALRSLARPEWAKYATHPYLTGPPGESQGFNA